MNNEIFKIIIELLVTFITVILVPNITKFLNSKVKNENLKYVINELSTLIEEAVHYTNQTYVEQLKKDGKFDLESQREALLKATYFVLDNLTETAQSIIEKENLDLEILIQNKIEAEIAKRKVK